MKRLIKISLGIVLVITLSATQMGGCKGNSGCCEKTSNNSELE